MPFLEGHILVLPVSTVLILLWLDILSTTVPNDPLLPLPYAKIMLQVWTFQ